MKEIIPISSGFHRRSPQPCSKNTIPKSLFLIVFLFLFGAGTSFGQVLLNFSSGAKVHELPGTSFSNSVIEILNYSNNTDYGLMVVQSTTDDYDIADLTLYFNGFPFTAPTGITLENYQNLSAPEEIEIHGKIPASAQPCDEGNLDLYILNPNGSQAAHIVLRTKAAIGPRERGDLVIRQDLQDRGDEPYLSTQPVASPDIWVRRQADGLTDHQNPDFVSQAGNANQVYAQVQNMGCEISAPADLRLYWTRARTHETWKDHWLHYTHVSAPNNYTYYPSNSSNKVPLGGEITISNPQNAASGSTPVSIPALNAWQSYVIPPVAWYPPNPDWYVNDGDAIQVAGGQIHPAICLLARVQSWQDPMNNEQSPKDVVFNITNNNNIAARNTYITNDPSYKRGPNELGNYDYGWASYEVNNPTGSVEIIDLEVTISSDDTPDAFQNYGNMNIALSDGLWASWQAGGGSATGIQVISDGVVRLSDPANARLKGIRLNPGDAFTIAFQYEFFGAVSVSQDLEYNIQLSQYLNGSAVFMGSPNHMITTVEAEASRKKPEQSLNLNILELNAYPNPAKESATVSFTLKEESKVSLYVRDLQGRKVLNLSEAQTFNAGQHSLKIDLKALRAGIYFIQMQTPDQFLTEKLIHQD